MRLVRTVRTHEAGHVLHDAQDLDAGLGAEIDLLPHIQQTDFLRRGHDHGAVEAGLLEEGVHAQVLVAGAGRRVHDQIVQLAPLDVFEELLDQSVLLRPPPDHGVVSVRQHELHAHDAEIVCHPHGTPAGVADVDGFGLDAHHFGDAGPANVGVHDADCVGRVGGEGVGEHGGEGGFANTAFAAEDEDFVSYTGEARGDERDVGVRPFGGSGADRLVGAAGAGGALAGEGGFGAGAVFWGV